MLEESNKHHLFGFSSLQRRKGCTGSYWMEKDLPEVKSKDSEDGIFLHNCIANTSFEYDSRKADLNEKENIKRAIKVKSEIMAGATIIENELPLTIKGSDNKTLLWGTADFVCVFTQKSGMGKERAIVIDWKTGFKDVEDAPENLQMAGEALAIHQRYGINEVEAIIYYPRFNRLDKHTFTKFDIILQHIEKIKADCLEPNALLIPSESNCKYCKGKLHAKCPKAMELIKSQQALFQQRSLTKDNISELTDPKTIVALKMRWDEVKQIGKALDDRTKQLEIDTPGFMQGYYGLQTRTGAREIKDTVKTWDIAKNYMQNVEFLKLCTPKATDMEKVIVPIIQAKAEEKGEKLTIKAAKEIFNEVFKTVITHKKDTVSLVRKG